MALSRMKALSRVKTEVYRHGFETLKADVCGER
jgi:hypothetical protein